MFDACVLGDDPGIARIGVAAVARDRRETKLVWAATVRTSAELDEASRLQRIAPALRAAIATQRPTSVAGVRVGG